VYSFGVFVWEVAARQRPWRGLDPSAIRDAVVGGSRLVIPADAPPVLAEVMRRCFSPRDSRPEMQELLAILNAASASAVRVELASDVVPGNSGAPASANRLEHPAGMTVADNAGDSHEHGRARHFEVENASDDEQVPQRRQRADSSGLHPHERSAESGAPQPPRQRPRLNPSSADNVLHLPSLEHGRDKLL
jgi:hypothetical protein